MGELIRIAHCGCGYRGAVEQVRDHIRTIHGPLRVDHLARSAPTAWRAVELAERAGLLPAT